jgi:hypothetical protein
VEKRVKIDIGDIFTGFFVSDMSMLTKKFLAKWMFIWIMVSNMSMSYMSSMFEKANIVKDLPFQMFQLDC